MAVFNLVEIMAIAPTLSEAKNQVRLAKMFAEKTGIALDKILGVFNEVNQEIKIVEEAE